MPVRLCTSQIEMEQYLKEFHHEDITDLLNDGNDFLHVSLNVNLEHLHRTQPHFFAAILSNVWETSAKWNRALLEVQKELTEGNIFLEPGFQIKENCHVRFVNLPLFEWSLKGCYPRNDQIRQFVQVKGNVVRMTEARLLEFKREYSCSRCKKTFILEADYIKMFAFETPRNCLETTGTCKGNLHPKNTQPKPEFCMDYQEIRIQELFGEKNVPGSLIVSLENDLVDSCHPGECITVCGTMERRCRPIVLGKRAEVIIALRAVSICKDEDNINVGKDLSEQLSTARAQWQETIDTVGQLNARDRIIQSICPEIHGMYLVKLAIALALCSGIYSAHGDNKRRSSHLLLVGDPGLAKSKLLKAASRIALRSVFTTGMGCSAAGLTAAAIKEGGEWHLEAGALVLADGGVCCIDEFNLMRETDKASIHEAMEQQTISMAKAGLVCELNTRCIVLAATNPKNLYSMSESEGTSFINIGIGAPLLSRFDIVLILRDERDPELDNRISDHILENANSKSISNDLWDMDRLQSHFLAIQKITPQLSSEANIILAAYYKYCRADLQRDASRTTVRLLDSLNRLTQAHARLMFREKAEAIDAIAVIRLMEASWGFGRLLNSIHILRENLPLGPNELQIRDVIQRLDVQSLENCIFENFNSFNSTYGTLKKTNEKQNSPQIGNLESLFGYGRNNVNKLQKNSSQHVDVYVETVHNFEEQITDDVTQHDNVSNNSQSEINENNSKIDSTLLDDSLGCELVGSIDFSSDLVEDHNETELSKTNSKPDCQPTSPEAKRSIPSPNKNLLNRLFPPFDLDSIDDADLELDIDVPALPKATLKIRENDQISNITKPLKEISDRINRKRSISSLSANEENITENKCENVGKKPPILSQTLAKLNQLMNPNLMQVASPVNNFVPVPNEGTQENKTEDSTYNATTSLFCKRPSTQSSSHILAAQDDDLSCLDFEF